jgi:hypothetical protein
VLDWLQSPLLVLVWLGARLGIFGACQFTVEGGFEPEGTYHHLMVGRALNEKEKQEERERDRNRDTAIRD